jgi:uncharacterized membrane protein
MGLIDRITELLESLEVYSENQFYIKDYQEIETRPILDRISDLANETPVTLQELSDIKQQIDDLQEKLGDIDLSTADKINILYEKIWHRLRALEINNKESFLKSIGVVKTELKDMIEEIKNPIQTNATMDVKEEKEQPQQEPEKPEDIQPELTVDDKQISSDEESKRNKELLDIASLQIDLIRNLLNNNEDKEESIDKENEEIQKKVAEKKKEETSIIDDILGTFKGFGLGTIASAGAVTAGALGISDLMGQAIRELRP